MEPLDSTLVSKKFSVTVPDKIFLDLERWAEEEGRPTANLAAFLVEQAVRAKYPDEYPKPNGKRGDDRHAE
jgi:hypothetical protein